MAENKTVTFTMGEDVTDTNPPKVAGQIVLDTAPDASTLYVDTDENTRLQVTDPTKMDKWAEVRTQRMENGNVTVLNTACEGVPVSTLMLTDGDYLSAPSDISCGIALETVYTQSYKYTTALFQVKLVPKGPSIAGSLLVRSGYNTPMVITLNESSQSSTLLGIALDAWNDGSDHAGIILSGIAPFISGLAAPTLETHAANKKYVDDSIASIQQTWIDW